MTEPSAWRTLLDGDRRNGVVLAVDFDTTGRPEARFSDLATNLTVDAGLLETIPPAAGAARSGADYVEYWAREIEASRPHVPAVFGFCGGAVYAAALAERIAGWQPAAPRLVLFDPELSTAQSLFWQFHKIMGFLTSIISAEQVAAARALGQRVYDECTEVGALKDELLRLARDFGEPALIEAGLDRTRRDELFEVFDSFLRYLAAASEIDPLGSWRYATAYCSSSPLSGLNAMRAAGLEIAVGEEIAVEVDHGKMLADPELAAAVSGLLSR